jgi:putative hydrolase of the HAD superfamily
MGASFGRAWRHDTHNQPPGVVGRDETGGRFEGLGPERRQRPGAALVVAVMCGANVDLDEMLGGGHDLECIIFDIGGVLIDQSLPSLATYLSARTGRDTDRILALFGRDVVLDVETGRVSAESFFEHTIGPQLPGIGYEDWIGAWMDNYNLNQSAWDLLEEARDRGRTVCILSNLSEFNKIAIERKYPHFFRTADRNFFSYELGLHKPDPAIYSTVSSRLGIAPAGCLFLDDVEENVESARTAGMGSIRFDNGRIEEIRRALGWAPRQTRAAGTRQ